MGDFSLNSALASLTTGKIYSGGKYYGSLFYHNSAVLVGTSGGSSALIDIIFRPHQDMPWQVYDVVITATQSLSGRVGITGVAQYWASRLLTAYSANGSAPAVTTFFDFNPGS